MTPDEARKLLRLHSGRDVGSDPDEWQRSFVIQLRPYRGSLREQNFLEVMEAIKALAPNIAKSKRIDREVCSDLWHIVWFPREWARERR